MSDRDALHAYIDRLSEDEVRSLWQRIQCEEMYPRPTLTAEEKAAVDRGLEASAEGRRVSLEEARRRFGLA